METPATATRRSSRLRSSNTAAADAGDTGADPHQKPCHKLTAASQCLSQRTRYLNWKGLPWAVRVSTLHTRGASMPWTAHLHVYAAPSLNMHQACSGAEVLLHLRGKLRSARAYAEGDTESLWCCCRGSGHSGCQAVQALRSSGRRQRSSRRRRWWAQEDSIRGITDSAAASRDAGPCADHGDAEDQQARGGAHKHAR